MKCPYCGNEMTSGYIQSRDSVEWDTKKRVVAALPSIRSSSIVLASGGGAFSGAATVAYNCQHCEKIIIDYSFSRES